MISQVSAIGVSFTINGRCKNSKMGQKIEIAEPSELFKPFVQYYKYIESDLTGIYKIIPIPDVELYFNFTQVNIFSPEYYDVGFPRIHLAGLHLYDQSAYSNMFGTERKGGFCIVFWPRGFYNLFRIKSSDCSKYAVTGDSVFKRDIYYLWEQLNSCSGINSMKELFENYFSGLATRHTPMPDLLDHIVGRISKTSGMIRVSQLCKIYNITPRSMERHFMEEIGISPKEMLQIFRINKAIRMLAKEPNANLAGLSYLSGYFDQSHFIKDIKRITGFTPGQLQETETGKKAVHNRLFIKNQQ
jgi:AraC-like DNA-binding protein